MKIESKAITNFIENLPYKCKSPLDKIIIKMLESSKYIDDSTIIFDETNEHGYNKEHYHNWDCNPKKISEINKFKNNNYNEENDIKLTDTLGYNTSPNIECIKGDIQLGKRVHACIMMWMSIYIYERPVLYLFRPLNIDKEQLQDDIDGTESWNFNIEWIKTKFNESIEIDNNKKYFDYRLPSLTDIKDKKVANKLSDKDYISDRKKIYMALMNPTDLDTLNKKFYEYIIEYHEKVNITLIIDESDLQSPTAENSNNISDKDTKNSKSERLISRLVNKVAHTIHITGTAHQFFWNFTTALSDTKKTFIPVQKVFVMKRHDNYFGFMKKNIKFSSNIKNLPIINEWWMKGRGVSKENKYDIIKDYKINIKNIISSIVERQNNYNSFLISEERIQNHQIKLAEEIINDFNSVFCVIFHGRKGKNGLPTGLRLYFPKTIDNIDIEQEIQQVVINEKRLDKSGGIKGEPTSDKNNNNYKYYDIDMKSKEFNIKMIYKVLSMLFKKIKSNKTVITITGKYGERGYSFTSDYYNKDNKYILHLTDQYFVSHTSYNCTDIFQRGRIQGKYTDNPNLIFWTTNGLVEIIRYYVDFITKIEDKIMNLPRGNEYIRNLCESFLYYKQFIKTLGRPTERKNLDIINSIKYDRNYNALVYSFSPNTKIEDYQECFSNWCREQNIHFNGFINTIDIIDREDFLNKPDVINYDLEESCLIFYSKIEYYNYVEKNKLPKRKRELENDDNDFIHTSIATSKKIYTLDEVEQELKNIKPGSNLGISYKKKEDIGKQFTRIYPCYKDKNNINTLCIKMRICKIKKYKLPISQLNILQKQNYKEKNNNKILYSKLNYNYINDNILEYNNQLTKLKDTDINIINDSSYFFLTSDGYVYHHDPEKSIKKVRIQIKSEIEKNNINPILKFKEECIIEIEGCNRIGVKKLMKEFYIWCKNNEVEYNKKLKDFREEFEKITGLKRSKSNIYGYKIRFKIK